MLLESSQRLLPNERIKKSRETGPLNKEVEEEKKDFIL